VRLVAVATGKPVGFRRAVGRQIAHLFDAIPFLLGYAWPLWDEQKQTFADKMCRTLVVQADL
jgi:RDD family